MSYLDVSISTCICHGKFVTEVDDKRFNIVNYPFMCSTIPARPTYSVYISQLIRINRICDNFNTFGKRHKPCSHGHLHPDRSHSHVIQLQGDLDLIQIRVSTTRGGFDTDQVDRARLKTGALAGNSPLHSCGRKSLVVLS